MDSQPKERPIIFSTPMVRALIEGRKTQTRRVVKPQPRWIGQPNVPFRTPDADPKGIIACPGNVGDRLWVKSTHWYKPASDLIPERIWHPELELLCSRDHGGMYEDRHATELQTMDVGGFRKRPSIHMPRWASRITLTITDVRVERLQDISEADAIAEGVLDAPVNEDAVVRIRTAQQYRGRPDLCNDRAFATRTRFQVLWNSIHGPGAWDANPWVWALTFTTEVRK